LIGKAVPPLRVTNLARPTFDRSDLAVGSVACLLSFAVYFWTLAPSVTLLDSGEFITAGQHFGVPHPTGYPLWTILAWVLHLLPLGNAAWEVNLLSAICGSLAVGIAASLCRSSLRWMQPLAFVEAKGLATVVSLVASLLFAFSLSMWSQAVIAEIYTLHALLVALVLATTYAWVRRQSLLLLLAIFFFLSLAFSNHQLTISLAPLPFLAVLVVRRRIFWDLVVAAIVTAELFYLFLAVLSQDALVLKAAMRVFYCLAGFIVIYMLVRKNRIRWRIIALLPFAVALGLLPYAYMPLASSTNPPMNWGYTRDVKGFFYSFNRSQYSGSLTSQSLRVVGPLVGISQKKDLTPPPPTNPLQSEPVSKIGALWKWSVFFAGQLVSSFTPLSAMAFLASLVGVFCLRDGRHRAWLVILLAAFALSALLQPVLDNATTDVNGWWLQMPFHSYTNLIFALIVGAGFFFCLAPLVRRFPRMRPGMYAMLLLPGFPLLTNFDVASQRDKWFGWEFGHDILKNLPKGSVLIGGTDPGRFVPTYMIFGESPQPAALKRDPNFDRRDVYIITQNALGDPFYMAYLRDHYSSERPKVQTDFERWLGRDHTYPEKPLVFPNPKDVERAIALAAKPDPVTGKRLEASDSILPFSAVLHWLWSQNRGEHDFFVEESFPMEWTYDYAIPHGLIFQLNKTKLDSLPDEVVAKDFAFWSDYKARLLNNPKFHADFDAQRSFSKLRSTTGNIYRHRKMFPEAERAYKEALELWPGEGGSLNALMLLQWQRGEFDEILARIDLASARDPSAETWKFLRTYALGRKDLQGKIEDFQAVLKTQPKNRDVRKQLVMTYVQVGQHDKAREAVNIGLKEHWDDPDFLRFAVGHFQINTSPTDSLDAAIHLVEVEPMLANNHYLLARAYYSHKNMSAFYIAAATAVKLGGIPMQSTIRSDPYFKPLQEDEAFKKLTNAQ